MTEFEIDRFDVENNICIEASAGTGKTHTVQLIVEELLKLKPKRSLENILIVTYTEKAAGELRDRIRAKIQEVLVELKKQKQDGAVIENGKYLSLDEQLENFEEQLSLVDNAPIFTIHSFCQQTLREFGFAAKQCDDMEMLDESEAEAFVEKWLRDVMAYDDFCKKYLYVAESQRDEDNKFKKDSLIKTYASVLKSYYMNSSGKEEADIVVLDKTVSQQEKDEVRRFSAAEVYEIVTAVRKSNGCYFDIKKIRTIEKFAEKIEDRNITTPISVSEIENQTAYEEYAARIKDAKGLLHAVNKSQHLLSKAKDNANKKIPELVKSFEQVEKFGYSTRESACTSNFPVNYFKQDSTHCDEFKDLIRYFSNLKDIIKTVANLLDVKTLKDLLFEQQVPELYKDWVKYKAENKKQDFDDMIRNVREAVCKSNSELLEKLKAKYNYAIIDEFQDTNQKQWDIFKRIFMKYDESTKSCEKEEGHAICVVGDPKQSIYAFQGADVNVYSSAIEDIKNSNSVDVRADFPYNLDRNFRSTNRMIDACNAMFKDNGNSDFFKGNHFSFADSHHPDYNHNECEKLVKPNAKFNGEETQPFWIPGIKNENGDLLPLKLEEPDFAKFAAQRIIECCTYDCEKTKLQVYRKGVKNSDGNFMLTDVSFSDFAVLCKSKSEMEEIKHVFSQCGIPYNHYKEANLFEGKECLDWIALFKAISAEDFSSGKRKILNECLYSSFFGVKRENLADEKFDLPDSPERQLILQWKNIAEKRKWALLQEQVFEKSGVEERLSKLDKLSSLVKLRQLGDYSIEYLYKNNCSIEELVDHLSLVSKKALDADEEDGNLVEKGTDFNAVQIMTVHASKGLEFPVVIAPAGLKGPANMKDGFCSYHDENNKLHITCTGKRDTTAEDKSKEEKDLEWKRIFYVAYTRASSLMILPWYAKVIEDEAGNRRVSTFDFLNTAFESSAANDDMYLRKISFSENFDTVAAKNRVKNILCHIAETEEETETEENWKNKLEEFSSELKSLDTHKFSYSNLSHGNKETERNEDNLPEIDNSEFDRNGKIVPCKYEKSKLVKINENYPRGNFLGEAVHQTFEMAEFERLGKLTQAESEKDSRLELLIRNKFKGQGINIDDDDTKEILNQTCKIVWNTLSAKFPEICGNNATGNEFSLKELKDNEHFAELEFNMNPEIPHNAKALRNYFNGFIDLVFVRKVNGMQLYSVLDWKTDSMAPENYASEEELKNHTDKHYSIQRVLYSYCLIKWLKQFNEGKSEKEIFDEQFGGIYYVFVRGTNADTQNGIYAHTWNSWEDLEFAFDKIVSEKLPEAK
ncbi:UvrD-helicase domain-containing protein [Treponema sp.]|uniref:UvrD-helicase domain-containing protein n=1 Tax=Treponema sp. TaxID=166 RepID=UPI00298DC420|nr:UvrD-helicase domain-containing protein [Treponema sp.]MCQ2240069.1 UvrD-helicase domain-containing protein [Treponema sp.]